MTEQHIELEDETLQKKLDEESLGKYLADNLEGYAGDLVVRQFKGGQSNPTFMLESGGTKYVLRKKPEGKLLPSAHAVDREYRVMTALRDTDVPVPKTFLLCEDDSVLGTPFFVMEYLNGRLFWDPALPELDPGQREACYREKNRVLAALHSVDYKAVGLEGYGKPGNYMARQISRWTKQYIAAKTEELENMDNLIEWLPANTPDDETACVVHGDYRFDNMMFHSTDPKVLGLLDWELSTLGHPLADLAYDCMQYYIPGPDGKALAHKCGGDTGIPTEEEYVKWYCENTGRGEIENWTFYMVFSMFRLASIIQGVYKRGLDGNASSPEALKRKHGCRDLSMLAWYLVNRK